MFDKIRKDYNRHGRSATNPAMLALAVYRFGRWKRTLPLPLRWIAHRIYRGSFIATHIYGGNHIPCEVDLGEGVHLIHAKDILLHPHVKIGNRVGIMHEVTIASTVDRAGVPEIGDDVFIGAGAKIVGPVKIGNGARIAPNSLVVNDVPAGATAIGVPARLVKKPVQSAEAALRAKAAKAAAKAKKQPA